MNAMNSNEGGEKGIVTEGRKPHVLDSKFVQMTPDNQPPSVKRHWTAVAQGTEGTGVGALAIWRLLCVASALGVSSALRPSV